MMKKITYAILLISALSVTASANDWFDGWYNADKWDVVGDAALKPENVRELVGTAGDGVLALPVYFGCLFL